MEVLENPFFFVSIVSGALILASVSAGFQYLNEENNKQVKPKAVLRDGILGAIFTAMAWMFLPDTMKNLTDSISSVTNTTDTTVSIMKKSIPSEYDVQVGPPRF